MRREEEEMELLSMASALILFHVEASSCTGEPRKKKVRTEFGYTPVSSTADPSPDDLKNM